MSPFQNTSGGCWCIFTLCPVVRIHTSYCTALWSTQKSWPAVRISAVFLSEVRPKPSSATCECTESTSFIKFEVKAHLLMNDGTKYLITDTWKLLSSVSDLPRVFEAPPIVLRRSKTCIPALKSTLNHCTIHGHAPFLVACPRSRSLLR